MNNNVENNSANNETDVAANYTDFKLKLIEKTYALYIQRMDIWEQQFYQIKYGCITLVIVLLYFRYGTNKSDIILNYIALAATMGFWIFETTLRITFSRYMTKVDVLTEIINNKKYMENVLKKGDSNAIRIFDFDTRIKTVKESITEYINVIHKGKTVEEKAIIINKTVAQKQKLISFWKSFKIKGALNYYLCIIILQILALVFYRK